MALSPERIQELDDKYGMKPAGTAQLGARLRSAWGIEKPEAPQLSETVGSKVAGEWMGSAEAIGGAVKRGAEKFGKEEGVLGKTGALLETGLGVASGAVRGIFAPLTAVIAEGMERTGATDAIGALADTETAQRVSKWAEENPDMARNLVDILNVATAGLGQKIGGGVLKTSLEKTGKEVVEEATRVGGEAIDIAQEGGKKIAGAIKPDTTGLSESLISGINRINPSKLKEFRAQQGVSEGEWLRERGIIGTREQTVTQLADNFQALKQNVDDALEKIPGTYRDSRITTVAEEAAEVAKEAEDTLAGRMAELAEKSRGVGLTTQEINEVKRFYERNVRVGYLKDPTKTSAQVQRATNRDSGIRESLFEIADRNGFTNLREINKEIQANKFLADEIAGRMEGQAANNMMTLTDWITITPGAVSPEFLAGFVAKKVLSTENVRAFAAKALAGFPKTKPLPRADLDEITKRAQELFKKMESEKIKQTEAAILADELQKSGFTMGTGEFPFLTETPIPLTRQEQMLVRAAKNKDEQMQMAKYILEQRNQGRAVGEGFTMQNIDNVPILNPKERFNPYRMGEDIEI